MNRSFILIKIFVLAFFLILSSPLKVSAWDTNSSHPSITSKALNRASNLDNFLTDFGLTNEKFDSLNSRDLGAHSARGWIFWGSIWEDFGPDHQSTDLLSPNNRFFNHYFDPVNNIGLTVSIPKLSAKGQILRDWANGIGSSTTPATPVNEFDWQDARGYFYKALTSESDIERKKYFAFTFRSIGQVVHLLEDTSQPSHVRNDPHVSPSDSIVLSGLLNPSRLEEWGKLNAWTVDISGNTARNYPGLDNYFNGLASLTNTNFFSDDTIFKNYSSPSKEQTNIGNFTFLDLLATVIDEDGQESRTAYITKTSGLLTGHKLAHAGYFSVDISLIGFNISPLQFEIDDRVAEENAKVLLPLAVEYSAGLINYFFRGEINMVSESGKYIIENNSDENMSGTFSLYYDDAEGKRNSIGGWNNIAINAKGKSGQLTFTEPVNPAPAEKGKYILVFQGKLGNEDGAVVGKVVNLQTEELILYVKNYTEYKIYNTKTKEVKPYKGILEGLKGNVIWREDGKALLGRYGYGYWYLIDLEKGTKHPVMDGNRYVISGGWKGQTAVMFGIDAYSGFKKILYWEGTADSGKFTQYNAPAGINFLTISPEGWGPAYGGPMIATSWDGGFVSYAGYYENDYYLVNFDTTNRVFSTVKVGMKQKTSGEIIWLCPEGSGVEPQTFTVTNYPILLSGESNSVRALYLNKETEVGAVSEGWNQKNSCYVPVSSYQNTKSNYSILGELTSEAQCSYTYNNTTKFYDRTCSTNNINIYPLYQALTKDGKQVIPFVKEEYTANNYKYWPQAFNKKASPCVFYGNETCPSGSIEIQRTWGSATTGMYSLVNINSKKDKVIGFVNTQLQAYSPYESKNLRTVFYVSNGEFHDITKENSDFVNSDFFMFIE